MDFCACPIHCRVHWRVGRRLGSCRLLSVQPLIGCTGVLYCQFWSIVLQSGARLPIYPPQTTGPCSQWCPVLNWGVFECDIAHRRSMAVLCILIRSGVNPVHALNGALPGPYVPVRVTRGSLVAHRYTYAPPRCRTSQYSRTFFPLSVSLWNDLANPVFDGVGLAGFKSRANAFLLAQAAASLL